MTNKNAAVESNCVGKFKDCAEKCSVIKITYRYTYAIPIGPMPVSKLNHGAPFRNIFNFAQCVAHWLVKKQIRPGSYFTICTAFACFLNTKQIIISLICKPLRSGMGNE